MTVEIHPDAVLEPTKTELLEAWLPQQRWYQAKGRRPELRKVTGFRLEDPNGSVALEVLFVRDVGSAEGTVYQVPVTYRDAPLEGREDALIGTMKHSVLGTRYVYDGCKDPIFTEQLLRVMTTADREADRSDGVVEMTVKGRPSPEAATLGAVTNSTVLRGEQSNTSIIYTLEDGTQVIAKLFRVLNVGANPDIELTGALTSAGSAHVPALYAAVSGSFAAGRHSRERRSADLAFVQEFLPDVRDAWREALDAARENRDFSEQARELGRTTAQVHRTLAAVLPTVPAHQDRIGALLDGMHDRSRTALADAGSLREHADAIALRIDAGRGAHWPELQRIHGDFHLGQVLEVPGRGWVLLDFEGEPLRPLHERSEPDVTVRDIAGMLRSFDYAGGTIEVETPGPDGDRRSWVDQAQAAFLRGYEEETGEKVDRDLLDLFVLDKALYEVSYEARNRPDWLDIPAGAVVRILESSPQASTVRAMSATPVHPLVADETTGTTEGSTMNATPGEHTPSAGTRGAPATSDPTVAAPGEQPDAAASSGALTAPASDVTTSAAPIAVDPRELDALLAGEHRDPHRVLGAHVNGDTITFRVIRPMARTVTVLMGDQRVPLTHEHGGVWVGTAAGSFMPDYRVLTTYEDGTEVLGDDPYRFMPTLGEIDLHLIGEGRHEQLWNALGAHVRSYPSIMGEVTGTAFSVWAPNAKSVRVIGDFNHWDGVGHSMRVLADSGVWELFVPDVGEGTAYKFEILGSDGVRRDKADPLARYTETAPQTASKVVKSHYEWNDAEWMAKRAETDPHNAPMSTYEVHLGSWRQDQSYRDLAEHLVNYVKDLGFTHVEFMPVMEHPYPPSWGYHVTSYYATNSRFGSPDDFRYLVDQLHQAGIGVILDWVPGHFATDEWALARFDGQALYEHPDPRRGWHPEWGSNIFDYGRPQVRNFLVANALYWLEEFHADGLRVDGVASMIYLDYARKDGEWEPNMFGGHENLEAVQLLQETNATAYKRTPGAIVIAEESTSWPGITRPTDAGGLGFGLKWNMGWMHDALDYFANEPIYRQYHHHDLTFALVYAFSEQFVLPISHDEVVHGKGSMLRKMPGDRWQQLANLRAFLAYQWAHPGKQLIFMGTEFGQEAEWADGRELDWWLLDQPAHYGVHAMVKDLNRTYREHPALWEIDHSGAGFRWLNANDEGHNAFTWLRFGQEQADGRRPVVAVVANFAGTPHKSVRVGLPHPGTWREIFNTDASAYGGSGTGNLGSVTAEPVPWDDQPFSAEITMPPLGVLYFEPEGRPSRSDSSITEKGSHMSNQPSPGERNADNTDANQSDAVLAGAPLEDQGGSAAGMSDGPASRPDDTNDEPVSHLGMTGTPDEGLRSDESYDTYRSEDAEADAEERRG